MASIIKRKKNYSVVYNYVDENGETKQKWETWHTHKEALKRKAEIENQQHTGTFLPPSNQTITEFLYDFVGSVKPNRAVSPTGNNSRGAFSVCSAEAAGDFVAQPPLQIIFRNCRNLLKYGFYQL